MDFKQSVAFFPPDLTDGHVIPIDVNGKISIDIAGVGVALNS